MSELTVTTYVEYLYPGAFFSEESSHPVTSRDPARIAREAPSGVFAFLFYDIVTATVTVDGQDVNLRSLAIRKTRRYYIDAEKLTSADVAALPGDNRILLANMRSNRWDPILRCRAGNFQPLENGDRLVSSATGQETQS